MSPLHRPQSLLAAAAVTLLLGLSACSGDDSSDKSTSDPSAAASDGQDDGKSETQLKAEAQAAEKALVGSPSSRCTADVAVTGAVKASWKGRSEVIGRNADDESDGPDALYLSKHKKSSLSVYSEGEGFEPAVTLGVAGRNFAADPEDLDGLDAAADGSGATAELTVYDVDGKEAQLDATFTCGKTKKQDKKQDKKG